MAASPPLSGQDVMIDDEGWPSLMVVGSVKKTKRERRESEMVKVQDDEIQRISPLSSDIQARASSKLVPMQDLTYSRSKQVDLRPVQVLSQNSSSIPIQHADIASARIDFENQTDLVNNIQSQHTIQIDSTKPTFSSIVNVSSALSSFQIDELKLADGAAFEIPLEVELDDKSLWTELLVGRFPEDAPHIGKIHVIVNKIWTVGIKGAKIDAFSINERMVKFRIRDARVRDRVLKRGMWRIADLPMVVSRWSPILEESQPSITHMPIWILIKNIPHSLFTMKGISFLASAAGVPKRLHQDTELCKSFDEAKVHVEVNLTRELPKEMFIRDKKSGGVVRVSYSYPWLPPRCSHCKKWGHVLETCLVTINSKSTGGSNISSTIERVVVNRIEDTVIGEKSVSGSGSPKTAGNGKERVNNQIGDQHIEAEAEKKLASPTSTLQNASVDVQEHGNFVFNSGDYVVLNSDDGLVQVVNDVEQMANTLVVKPINNGGLSLANGSLHVVNDEEQMVNNWVAKQVNNESFKSDEGVIQVVNDIEKVDSKQGKIGGVKDHALEIGDVKSMKNNLLEAEGNMSFQNLLLEAEKGLLVVNDASGTHMTNGDTTNLLLAEAKKIEGSDVHVSTVNSDSGFKIAYDMGLLSSSRTFSKPISADETDDYHEEYDEDIIVESQHVSDQSAEIARTLRTREVKKSHIQEMKKKNSDQKGNRKKKNSDQKHQGKRGRRRC